MPSSIGHAKQDDSTNRSMDFPGRFRCLFLLDHNTPVLYGRPPPRNLIQLPLIWSIGNGEVEMYQTHLPVGPLDQQVDFQWFADRRLSRWVVWYLVGNWISQWAQDIKIWENKIFQKRPRLCRDDGPVFRLRRWYAQFLPEEATGRLID